MLRVLRLPPGLPFRRACGLRPAGPWQFPAVLTSGISRRSGGLRLVVGVGRAMVSASQQLIDGKGSLELSGIVLSPGGKASRDVVPGQFPERCGTLSRYFQEQVIQPSGPRTNTLETS